MNQTTLASFRFPLRLTALPRAEFAPQDIADALKIDPGYFHQSFRRKFKPKPVAAESGDLLTGEHLGRALEAAAKTGDAHESLASLAALADFHRLIVREDVDRLEAIEPDFARWRECPGAYVLWTARVATPPADPGAEPVARLRIVRQIVAGDSAVAAVAAATGLSVEVAVDGEDMVVAYVAARTRALADR